MLRKPTYPSSIFFWISSLLAAAVMGIGSAWLVIDSGKRGGHVVQNGPWSINPLTGSRAANVYARAQIARSGLLALSQQETIYYTARMDEDGHRLRCDQSYRIEGWDIPSRWWSITVYGEDYFLIPNERERYSYNMMNLEREGRNGKYTIALSRTPREGNWIPLGDGGGYFELTLRIYNPAASVLANLGEAALPSIIREGDADDE